MLICVLQDDELHSACGDGNLLLVQCLVKQGANVNSKSGLVSVISVQFLCNVPVSIHKIHCIEEVDLW